MKIFLIRNAISKSQIEKYWPHEDDPLSSYGTKQAKMLKSRFEKEHIDMIYSSDSKRSIDTVEFIALDKNVTIVKSADFRSFNVGKYYGYKEEEVANIFGPAITKEMFYNPSPTKRYFEGGETLLEENTRTIKKYNEILEINNDKSNIIISTHMTNIHTIFCYVLGLSLEKIFKFNVQCASVSLISINNNDMKIEIIGSTDHLAALELQDNSKG
jgi:probable phosphoglycerate mutase